MFNKKGLSSVVSNVLIILLIVFITAALGIFIFNFLNTSKHNIEYSQKCSLIDLKPRSCNIYPNGMVFVLVDFIYNYQSNLSGIQFSFNENDGTEIKKVDRELPYIGGSQGFYFDGVKEADKANIYPIFDQGNYICSGREIVCNKVSLSEGNSKCNFVLNLNFINSRYVDIEYTEDNLHKTLHCSVSSCSFSSDKGKDIKLTASEGFLFYKISFLNPSQGISQQRELTLISECQSQSNVNLDAYFSS